MAVDRSPQSWGGQNTRPRFDTEPDTHQSPSAVVAMISIIRLAELNELCLTRQRFRQVHIKGPQRLRGM